MMRRKQALDRNLRSIPRFYHVGLKASLGEVVEQIVTNNTHHVFVLDDPSKCVVGVISLSDIIKSLYKFRQ